MSAHTRKHHTSNQRQKVKFVWHGVNYSVPFRVIEKYKVDEEDSKSVSVNEVFGDLISEYTAPGLLLRGLRHKEGLTQVEFAKRIGISQNNLSAIENGHRGIGKEMAKRIANQFGVDYRIFL